jgi:polysaccharide pyruvyl transferase WcaK-like protein
MAVIRSESVEAPMEVNAAPSTGATKAVQGPRVALLSPYNGGNFGDAAIQDAVIANLRLRLPNIRIAGITLGLENFLERHGTDAFPLCASVLPFYAMGSPWAVETSVNPKQLDARKSGGLQSALKGVLRKIPMARSVGRKLRPYLTTVRQELRHAIDGYRFLRGQKLLIVSGGGQLDEESGGPWGHPYHLFKWAVTAKVARIPVAIASVGAGKTCSTLSRFFLGVALRLANYRSYREVNTRNIASKWLPRTITDAVVPDLAFSLPLPTMPGSASARSFAQGRPVVALSLIAYARPGTWPYQNRAIYERYKAHIAEVISQLVTSGYFVVLVWSSAGDDDKAVSDLLACLDEKSKAEINSQIYIPKITNWKELVAVLRDVDILVASRLHSTILGFLTNTPVVAISFDPKVDWVMQDVGQTDYLLHINNFMPEDVLQALQRLSRNRKEILEQIAAYRQRISALLSLQYDTLAKIADANWNRPKEQITSLF